MKGSRRAASAAVLVLACALLVSTGTAQAFQIRQEKSRFDALVVQDETASLDVATTPLSQLPATEALRAGWDAFKRVHGGDWSVYLDRRSGAPMLVEGKGIRWALPGTPTPDAFEPALRAFLSANRTILLADDTELALDRDASTQLTPETWQIVFDHVVSGVRVDGEKYLFTIGYGNLISFGASRWSRIEASPFPDLEPSEAVDRLFAYMQITGAEQVSVLGKPALELVARRAAAPGVAAPAGPYTGPTGAGYGSALVWTVAVKVAGEPGTWVGRIDAHSGDVVSFVDDNKYGEAKGGVYPLSNDHNCPDGCLQSTPLPYANITGLGPSQNANALGVFNCSPQGGVATTTLAGQYIRVSDNCGSISESVTCDGDLDLQSNSGTDCATPAGASAGNTNSARTSYYHLNRIAEHARTWLPGRVWLTQQLNDNVNLNNTCNAYWDGANVNFFKSGGGCANTGELAGVFLHEWGHGLDQNDGGGFDNPSEAYADITSIMSTHVSCLGRGFTASNCGGYGDACLSCTGIRELDWGHHASNTPATPNGFAATHCPGGGAPCGREVHCEGEIGGETLWDFAVRDLTAAGLDQATAWQVADKLWYKSRNGSGGNGWNCSLPNSDGCSANSWFSKLRNVDDDDGNLANGTPHAAAIYAAFNRHAIACGLATDASNQNHTSCPTLTAPALTSTNGSASVALNWGTVAGATQYYVLRNDASCAAGFTIVATTAGTTFTDTGLANGFTEYYRVQPVTTNPACDGVLSNCQTATPQPFAGVVKLDAAVYSCTSVVGITVIDGNAGSASVTVNVSSTSEPGGELVTLNAIAPGSATYTGTINVTTAPAAADGLLSLADGNTITAAYVDADDGQGGFNLTRQTGAVADCAAPEITKVETSNLGFDQARITWKTNEPGTSVVNYGPTIPPGSSASSTTRVLDHSMDLSGLAECTTYSFSVGSTDAVGNTANDNLGGAYYTFKTGKNASLDFPSTDTPRAIPDYDGNGITSSVTVTQTKPVLDVNVTVNITHPTDGDLGITLIAPNGVSIPLAFQRGGSGDNYTGTVFDDEAVNSITTGAAPFTASYRPESPLSVLDGINAAGTWSLRVEDDFAGDTGTLDSWKLTLSLPSATCGPSAAYQSDAVVTDTCGAGGPGNANGVWDAGESVQFRVTLANTGTVKLTGVQANITTSAPGVVMTDGNATFGTIGIGGVGNSIAPNFTVQLPTSLACGATIPFNIQIIANEGTWNGSFTQVVGRSLGASGNALNESFASGIPATWSVVDGGSGGGVASTWTTANPGLRAFVAPLSSPVVAVDSDRAGSGAVQDEQLITPSMNLSTAPIVSVSFDQFFRWFSGGLDEAADVDVRSSATGGSWVNVLHQHGASSANPDHQTVDISSQASRATNVQVRFHDTNGSSEWYWLLDNVRVDTANFQGCDMPVCGAAQPNVARPVPDGLFGTPMRASRANAAGSSIALTWDNGTCSSADNHVLYGDLSNVASLAPTGAGCDLGTSGSSTWNAVPAGNLWFVVVGDNNATIEGTWGTDGVGGQRGGTTASGFCGATTRNNGTTCP